MCVSFSKEYRRETEIKKVCFRFVWQMCQISMVIFVKFNYILCCFLCSVSSKWYQTWAKNMNFASINTYLQMCHNIVGFVPCVPTNACLRHFNINIKFYFQTRQRQTYRNQVWNWSCLKRERVKVQNNLNSHILSINSLTRVTENGIDRFQRSGSTNEWKK